MLDLFKGISAVQLASVLMGHNFAFQAIAGVAVVVGHNFPIWLSFKGGRGLATAAGVVLVIAWPLIPIWGLLWVIGYALTKQVNMGNAIACVAEMIGVLVAPSGVLSELVGVAFAPLEFRIFGFALFSVILVRHIKPVREYLWKSGAIS